MSTKKEKCCSGRDKTQYDISCVECLKKDCSCHMATSPKEPEEEWKSVDFTKIPGYYSLINRFTDENERDVRDMRKLLAIAVVQAKSQGAREALALCCDECKSKVKL